MKKITFMFIFLICSVGFSQTNNSGNVPISDLGDNNPTYAQSEPRVSSNVETIAISSLGGENNPTHAQSEPRVYSDARTIPIPGTSDYKQGFENLVSIPFIPNQNGAGSDDCTGATDVFAGETYVGNTGDYTDTGGNAAPDVWYAYSGAAGAVTLSLCDGATDYDSYLRVFDACGGTEIASNDDSCSLQSELEFTADGTSTYYIMVEGYGSGSGNYSLSVSVLSPSGGDTCDNAYPVVSGETYVGDTSTMTDTGSNPSPDAWYSYMGAAGDVTLSLCEGTDYDSYLRVFDACGGTEIASNDDACSVQSELVFAADAGATYYIMVEGYSSSSGNFSLAVSVEEEEEEEWGPCENGTTSNEFENGYGGTVCNDVVVAADDNLLLEEIMPSYFHDVGAVFESIDVRIFSADFGTLIYEQAGAPVISQEYQGENYGFDISKLSILIAPVDMPGTSGAETSYWVELSNAVTSGTAFFWELESTEVIGQPYYVGEAGAGGIVDDVTDGVFVWDGQCGEGGGGGGENDCGIGNVEPDGEGGNFGVDYLLGVSYTLEEEGTINSINMIGNGSGSLVQMAVYNDLGGVPDDLIVFSEIAEVGNGMTVYPVTPTVIPPGDYWIMAVYEFQGDHSNVLQETGNPVYYTALPFGDPIPTNASDFLSYADRDFLYSLDITCSGGGGEGGPCENGTASNEFENGYSGPICNDVVVAADDNFLLEEIMPSYFHDIGAVFESIDVRIFSADFGTLIYEQAGAPVISQVYQGENYGFDVSMLSILIDPVDMPGTSGAETSYWVELSNAVTSGASTFWELESTEVIGQPYYVGEAGAGGIVDDVTDGVFSWAGQCGSGGGGEGGPCENGTASNAFENGYSGPICNDVVVAADDNFLLEEIMPSYFHDIGAVFESIDVRIFSADFGTLIYEQAGAPVISQEYQGENYGFDVSMLSILIDPVDMPGTSGAETSYWVELSNAVTSGASTFWELESTEVIGQPYYVGEAGAGGIVDDVTDGVFSWAGQCESGGGGGGGLCDDALLEINQDFSNTCMANISQGGIAQSYKPLTTESAGAGFQFEGAPSEGTDLIVSLWDELPNNGGMMLTSGVAVANGSDVWIDVFWDVATTVPGTTYYIVVEGSADQCISGSLDNSYPDGNLYANDGYTPYPDYDYTFRTYSCDDVPPPAPANNLCENAIAVECDGVYAGETATATDTGGNPAPDVWYSYSGAAGDITLSLCDGGTDYDSYLRVYDACDGTEIADNDDSCDLQSELTFVANGTSTYYIMVEGYGSNSGNFSLEVFCELLGTNDNTIEGFSFYPNPATDAINLSSTENIERVTIYNILGQKVIDQDINATSSQLNVSNLVTGAYLMQVSVDGKTATYKVLKN